MTPDNLYLQHQDTIESVLAHVCRANRLSADDRDEFSSTARLKLIDDDCAVLRKFAGLSSFKTFIVVVVNRLFLDWRIKEWGKWRPTPAARRLGRLAVELERLVLRDRIDYAQAVEVLISKGIAASEAECDDVRVQLRWRSHRQRIELDDAFDLPAMDADPIVDRQRRELARRVIGAMHDAIAKLSPDDHLLFKLRYQDRFTVAKVAKLAGGEPKKLYRRYAQIEQQLRSWILAAGVSQDEIRDLFAGFDVDEDNTRTGEAGGNSGNGPSITPNAGGVPV